MPRSKKVSHGIILAKMATCFSEAPNLRRIYQYASCGVHSVDTKSEIVKILHFKQFYKHYVFNEDGDGGRKKVLKNYIDVYVCIDMVCGDTKGELGNEE